VVCFTGFVGGLQQFFAEGVFGEFRIIFKVHFLNDRVQFRHLDGRQKIAALHP
jgi:hypothetical protein